MYLDLDLPRFEMRTPTATILPLTTTVTLPRRFDVHQVDELTDRIVDATGHTRRVAIDGALVEMIDRAGLEALSAVVDDLEVEIRGASVALTMTAVLTGFDSLATACGHPVAILEAA